MRANARPAVQGRTVKGLTRALCQAIRTQVGSFLVFQSADSVVAMMAVAEHLAAYDRMRARGKVEWAFLPLVATRVSLPRPWASEGGVLADVYLCVAERMAAPNVLFVPGTMAEAGLREGGRETFVRVFVNARYPLRSLLANADQYLAKGTGPFAEAEDILAHEIAHAVDDRALEGKTRDYANLPTEVRAFMTGLAHELAREAREQGIRDLPVSRQAQWIDLSVRATRQWDSAVTYGMSERNKKTVLKGVWQHLVDEGYFAKD